MKPIDSGGRDAGDDAGGRHHGESIPGGGHGPRGHVPRLLLALTLASAAAAGRSEDWPVHRHDRLRTAVTGEQLVLPLTNVWRFRARVAAGAPPMQRSTIDREAPNALFNGRHTWFAPATPDESRWSLPITAAGDSLYFTSHDGRIVCLAAATGEVRWEFLTEAAVTQAATVCDGRVYAGSDDGHAYALAADTGKLIWKYKAAPADRWMISYDRLSSLWPVRTDVLVDDGVAYFAAGIFPHDGVYVHAVRTADGTPVWQPGGVPFSGNGLSGYPLLTRDMYHCPVDLKGFNRWPMFRRGDGVHDWTAADPERATAHFCRGNGRETQDLGVFCDGVQYMGSFAKRLEADGKQTTLWQREVDRWYDPSKCLLAGDTLFYLADDKAIWGAPRPQGGEGGAVIARRAADGEELWSFTFAERPHDLIVATGRLFVSTRQGTIYAFALHGQPARDAVVEATRPDPVPDGAAAETARAAAESIVAATGVKAGYAVVLDCEDGGLAWQLAVTTRLYVVAVFADAERAQAARERFAAADLHGSRVAVWHGPSGARLPVPARVIDLVTSEATLSGAAPPAALDEVTRLLKPIRGTACFLALRQSRPPASWHALNGVAAGPAAAATGPAATWTQEARGNDWAATFVCPALAGAGAWGAHRGGPENTNCSHDAALRGPLGVAWYGPPSVRRGSYAPPLLAGGVLLCALDDHHLAAHDQYNGRLLWSHAAEGIGASVLAHGAAGGNLLFTIHGGRCLRMRLYEGGEPTEVPCPLAGGEWTALAVSRDGQTLWGQARRRNEKNEVVGGGIFAIDTQTDRTLWTSGGPDVGAAQAGAGPAGGWQSWNAIADGRIYIVGPADERTRRQAIDETRAYLVEHHADQVEAFDKEVQSGQRALRTLSALDARTGEHLYDHGIDMTHTGVFAARSGYVVGMTTQGVDRHRKNPIGGPPSQGLGVWDGATGRLRWKRPGDYTYTPVVTNTTIYAEPWAYDLATGRRVTRVHPVSGRETDLCWLRKGKHCGGYNGSEHFLFGRNMGVGIFDTLHDDGMYTFWHSRVACSTDVATGGGMMIKPPYALGCSCPWSLPFTVALAPVDEPPEASFDMALVGPALPVRHVRLNFGAEGERRDREGNVWLQAGRRQHGLYQHVESNYTPTWTRYPGVKDFQAFVRRSNVHTAIADTDLDFVFACGERGMQRCVVPLAGPDEPPGTYLLRLGFCGLPGERVGQRVFAIRVNDETVEESFDAWGAAGAADRAVWREFSVSGRPEVVIEFVAVKPEPTLDEVPIIAALEVIRQDRPSRPR